MEQTLKITTLIAVFVMTVAIACGESTVPTVPVAGNTTPTPTPRLATNENSFWGYSPDSEDTFYAIEAEAYTEGERTWFNIGCVGNFIGMGITINNKDIEKTDYDVTMQIDDKIVEGGAIHFVAFVLEANTAMTFLEPNLHDINEQEFLRKLTTAQTLSTAFEDTQGKTYYARFPMAGVRGHHVKGLLDTLNCYTG